MGQAQHQNARTVLTSRDSPSDGLMLANDASADEGLERMPSRQLENMMCEPATSNVTLGITMRSDISGANGLHHRRRDPRPAAASCRKISTLRPGPATVRGWEFVSFQQPSTTSATQSSPRPR